ncbi:hypothetical protein FOZ63_019196, partial [Perkinsus olseni]
VHAVGSPQVEFLWILAEDHHVDVNEACNGAGFEAYPIDDAFTIRTYAYPEDDKPTGDSRALPVIPDPMPNNYC